MLNLRSLIITGEVLVFSAVCTGCFSAAPADEQQYDAMRVREPEPCITPQDAERMADQVLQLINLERAERNLQPVLVSETLTKIAEDYACRMIDGKFFGHRSPLTDHGPAERAVAGKYTFYAVGENLAAGPESPAEVMKLWMDSPPHHDIILDPTWKEVGIAIRAGGEYSTYWVQEFGDPVDF